MLLKSLDIINTVNAHECNDVVDAPLIVKHSDLIESADEFKSKADKQQFADRLPDYDWAYETPEPSVLLDCDDN